MVALSLLSSPRNRRLISPCISVVLAAVLLPSPQLSAQAPARTLPQLKADESLRPAIEKSLRVQALRDTRDRTLVQLMIQVDDPPVGMGFDVSLRVRDRNTRAVGSVAWSEEEIGWWAFDVDVPFGVRAIDVVLAPNAEAAAKLKRRNNFRLKGLESIWSGEELVLKGVEIRALRLAGMMQTPPPSSEEAREDQTELLEGDDPVIQQFKRDGDLATARRQLERSLQENAENATAWFNLGCLTVACGEWREAMDCFVKTRQIDAASPLADKAQHQLRRIGGYFVYAARDEDVEAMRGLGLMYQRGWGPRQDRQEAKRWFRNAANAGDAEAMLQLGVMYEQDWPGAQNNPKAEAWYRQQALEMYRKAADLGNEEASKWMATHD